MRPLFHPQLVNGPFGDPALYVECLHQRRALLFDAGELQGFPPGKLLKVTHVFVSHTHMDHFIGFDHLVRLMLGRPKTLRVFGPAPILDQVIAKLSSYSWNLVEGYGERLVLEVTQVREGSLERVFLDCAERFRDPGVREVRPFDGCLCRDPFFVVRAVLLDHKLPCMGFCLEETRHIQILKTKLQDLGLRPGPWLRGLREAILRGEGEDLPIEVEPRHKGPVPLGQLREHAVRISPGQRIAYVVDAGYCEANRQRVLSLARGADILFIEAAFLRADRDRAEATSHLTAFQAGRLAWEAAVRRAVPFHFSPKYSPDPRRLLEEMNEGLRGPCEEAGEGWCEAQGERASPP